MDKLKYIDCIRGWAIIGVIIVHCGEHGSKLLFMNSNLAEVINSGRYGVQLFFMASAFTLFLSMRNRKESEEHVNYNFFVRRFFRIAPMYYVGILYYTFERVIGFSFLYTGKIDHQIPWLTILANTFFIHGIHPEWINSSVPGGWSITVEMSFYLLIPFLFSKIKSLNSSLIFLFITLVFIEILNYLLAGIEFFERNRFIYYFLPNQLPIFAMGITCYHLIKEKDRTVLNNVLVLFMGLVFFYCFKPLSQHFIFGLGFTIFFVYLSKTELKLFVNSLTAYIGKVSYSMYITHFAVFALLYMIGLKDILIVKDANTAILNYFLRFIAVFSITIAVSTITYHIIELPFQRFGRKLLKP